MTPSGLIPAEIQWRDDGTPYAPAYGDLYHPRQGAYEQARQVFLAGNGLPERWRGRRRFVVLELGFGLGLNFLATWQAWREDAQRCDQLHYVALEGHPPRAADLQRAHAGAPLPQLAQALLAQWPPASPDLHRLDFDDDRVHLHLAFGAADAVLPQLQARFDACFLDGFAPARNAAMWAAPLMHRLARLAAPGATAATWSAARAVREGLAAAGFEVQAAPGFGGKRDITVARHAPRFRPPAPPAWAARELAWADGQVRADEPVLVIGAGLAGAAAARALAREGWPACVLEAADAPARGASSNPAGLFHAAFSAPDGLHARWLRAAALYTSTRAAPALADGRLAGDAGGLLQLQAGLSPAAARAALDAVGLPAGLVDWLDVEAARARSGVAVPAGGWWFGAGGWLDPAGWVREMLRPGQATGQVRVLTGRPVQSLRRDGPYWQAVGPQGQVWACSRHVVLANAAQAQALLQGLPVPALQQQLRRGQVTRLPPGPLLSRPRVALAGAGYALALPDGGLLCGATQQVDDDDAAVRAADHIANLRQAAALGCLTPDGLAGLLSGLARPTGDAAGLQGQVGWRMTTPDRLPLVGPPPDLMACAARAGAGAPLPRRDAVRHLPRLHDGEHGLYLLAGLGSRGLTSASLAGELLAHWITGSPCPVPVALRDALDPARQWLRAQRRGRA